MVDFAGLNDVNIQTWQNAADEWLSLSKWALKSAQDIHDQGAAPLAKNWTDKVGKDAGKKLAALADELEAGADIMRGVTMVLDGLVESMQLAQQTLKIAYDIARNHGIGLDDNGNLLPNPDHIYSPEEQRCRADITALIAEALRQATDADEKAWPELDRLTAAVSITEPYKAMRIQDKASQTEADILACDIPDGKDPTLVREWWNGLTDKQRHDLMRAEPVALANLDGIPDKVKLELCGTDGKFDRVKMVQWALANWDSPDKVHFENNCTNFTSEALFQAGMQPKVDPWTGMMGDNTWGREDLPGILPGDYEKKLYISRNWSYADGLQNFLLQNGGSEVSPSEAKPGDIIFYDQDGPRGGIRHGEAHHAAVVTSVTPEGEIKYTQHDASYKDVSLEGHLPAFVESKGTQRIRIVRPSPNWY